MSGYNTHRHSIYNASSSNSMVIALLRSKIKSMEKDHHHHHRGLLKNDDDPSMQQLQLQQLQLFDPVLNKTIVQIEQVLINKRPKSIRRVYIMDHKYRVGWVVDWDIHACMVCHRSFGWFYGRFKHHCRACGYLVCHDCSPCSTAVPGIDEPKGSRVCSSCYGLKSASLLGYGGVTTSMTNTAASYSSMKAPDNSSSSSSATATTTTAATTGRSYIEKEQPTLIATTLSSSPQLLIGEGDITYSNDIGSRGSVRRRKKTLSGAHLSLYSSATIVDAMGGMVVDFDEQIRKMELEQMPFYEQDYRKMREYVPVDVHVSNLKNIIAQGLPEAIATRIWEMKILWLICMHKDDIYKIHLADFRSKYVPDGSLDVVELRAIWFNLPQWDENSSSLQEQGKAQWRAGLKSKLDNQLYRLHKGTLSTQHQRHPVYYGYELLHLYDPMVPLQTRFNHGASSTQYTVEHHHRSNDDGYAAGVDGDNHDYDYDTTRVQREYTQTLIRPLSLMRIKEAYLSNFIEGDESSKTVESLYIDDDDGGDADADDDDEVARGSRTLRRDVEYKQQSVNEVSVVEYYHGEDNDEGSSMSDLRSRTDFDYKDRAYEYEHHPPPTPPTPSPLPLALVSPSSSSNIMHPMVSTPAYNTNTPYNTGETIVSGISSSAFSTELIGSNPTELKRPISFRFRSPVSPLYVGDAQETISSSINIDRLHNIPNMNINVSDDDGVSKTMNSSPVNIQLDPSRSNKYYSPPIYQDNRSNTSPVLTQNYHHHGNHFVSYQNQTNKSSVSSHDKSINRPIVVSSSSSSSSSPVSHQQSYSITHLHSTAPISSSSSSNRSVTIVEDTPPEGKTRSSIIQDNRTVSALSRSSISSSASSSTKHHASKSNVSHHRVVQIITTGSSSTNPPPLIHTTNSSYSHNSNTVSSSVKLFKSLDESSDLSEHSDSTTSSLSSFEVLNDSSAIAITDTADLSPNEGGMESYTNNLQQSININMNQSGGVGDGIGVLLHVDDDLSYNTTDDVDIAATLGEHVSTITSAPLAMQSDLDVASSSIPSKSSKSPTNATADRYYRRFKKRATALDGGGLGNNVNTTPTAANILLGTMTIHPVSSIISNRSTSADDSISITTPTGSAASSSIYRNKAVDKDQFRAYVLQGDAANARLILRNYSTTNRNNLLVDANEATDLMIQLFSTRSQHLNVDIVKLLVDGLNANINGMELLSGRRPLHYTIDLNHAEIGSYLIARGADVFAQDNIGSCPLVMSLNNHLTWLLQAYEDSGMQSKLLTSNNNNSTQMIADYTSYLVLAGYSKHVSSLLKAGLITITSEEATALLTSCHGNFENMLEPIDMFELLESLGAAI